MRIKLNTIYNTENKEAYILKACKSYVVIIIRYKKVGEYYRPIETNAKRYNNLGSAKSWLLWNIEGYKSIKVYENI